MLREATAAITLFTRLPAWKIVGIDKADYDNAVVFWPLTGWITAAVSAVVIWAGAPVLSLAAAVIVAICIRLLTTCALHEDGLADFCDGFGGGHDKERILAIMKDSHIGTYGTIGLIMYLMLTVSLLSSLPPSLAAAAVLGADPFCKLCAGQLTNFLPYARPEGARNKILYRKMRPRQLLVMALTGTVPLLPLVLADPVYAASVFFPVCAFILLAAYMKRKIGGYTGDCCGAVFLICEVTMLGAVCAIFHIIQTIPLP